MKLDQLSDSSNLQLYRLMQGIELPNFVKEAELDTEESVASLEKTAYADQVNIAFPINTPARVYVSNAFFQSKKAEMANSYGTAHTNAVENRIKEAAELFSISREIANYNELTEKRANKDFEPIHICVIEDEASEVFPLFPVKTAEDFIKSAEVFANNVNKYPFEWREQIAKGFLSKSAQFGVSEMPDIICKYAGLFFPIHTTDMASEINRRAHKLASSDAIYKMESLANVVETCEFDSIDEVMKVAHIVQLIEYTDGVYDRPRSAELLPDPVDRFFVHPPTKVAEMLDVVEMAGEKYQLAPLSQVPAEKYKEAFGIDLDPANKDQLRDVLPTMPLSDVTLFKELTGVSPV